MLQRLHRKSICIHLQEFSSCQGILQLHPIQSGEAFDLLLVKSVNNEINTGDEDFEDLESKEKVEFSEDFDEEDFEELN